MKFLVEYKMAERLMWDYVEDYHVIEADDEKDAISIAKAKFLEFFGGAEYAEEMGQEEFTEEEVNSWTWRAAEVLNETEYCYKTYYETSEFVYAA